MKISVSVDLGDFYNEGDESFKEQILADLSWKIKDQIWTQFKSLALDDFKAKIDKKIQETTGDEVNKIVADMIENKVIKKSSRNGELVTLPTYINEVISGRYFDPNNDAERLLAGMLRNFETKFQTALTNTSKSISDELINRYDLMFASQIVKNLNKAGMLKEDVVKVLTEGKDA